MRRFAPFMLLAACGCAGWFGSSSGSGFPTVSDRCIERMTKVNDALLLYAADYNDVFPPASAWMDSITPYIFPQTVNLRCPAVEAANPAGYGFAMHVQIAGQSVNSFPMPENIVTVFECTSTAKNVSGTEALLPNPARHNGLNTIARLDGSVRGVAP